MKPKMNKPIPTINLPRDFNMSHLKKFAHLYTELISINKITKIVTFRYSNGKEMLEMPVVSEINKVNFFDKNFMTELLHVYNIWQSVSYNDYNGFTKNDMIKLNEINKNLKQYIENHTPYKELDDPYETWMCKFKLHFPNTHYLFNTD